MSTQPCSSVDHSALAQSLAANPQVQVAWLYGSRAQGNADEHSDVDIAVALSPASSTSLELYPCDAIASQLTALIGVIVSVVDINKVPVPLAYNVITNGHTLTVKSDLRLRSEEQRIWSLWESYRFEHQRGITL